MSNEIELVFTNHETGNPPFKRFHAYFAGASEEVRLMRLALRDAHGNDDPQAYAGNAIAYGPGLGPNGRAIAWPIGISAHLLAAD